MIKRIKRIIKPYKMAIISVFISMLCITLVSIVSMVGEEEINNELNGLGLNGLLVSAQDEQSNNITNEIVYNTLLEYPDIIKHTPIIYDYATIEFSNSKEYDAMAWGISTQGKDIANLEMLSGEFFSDYQIEKQEFVCVIDEELALSSYGRTNIIGKEVLLNIGKGVYNFKVIGVLKKTSNLLNGLTGADTIPNFVYIPYTIMLNNSNKTNFDQIMINTKQKDNIDEDITNFLFKNLDFNNELTINVSNLSQQRDTINNIVEIAFFALFAVSCVAVVVGSISVATSVTTAVNIKKRDIGIKISLGASRLNIMFEFFIASILATLIGISLGVFFGGMVLLILNLIVKNNYIFDYSLLITGIFVTIFFAGVFSLYPSYKAAILTPVEALNRE